ncbi:MAG: B12-binding domain-containing radical SAM protein [Coriobacteriia bacterium]|nr:B12-binding domain-containing radical SAM protein [Coriobacteriia bacterium]
MHVLLIEAPVAAITAHSHLSPPLGLAYVAQHLLDAGHDVELIDLNLTGLNPARLTAALNRFGPDVVGISSHTETYPNALAIARQVKERDSAIPVMIGGPHVSIVRLEALAEPDLDYIIVGEGERTAVELVAAIETGAAAEDIEAIAGLGHKARGVPVLNPPRPPLGVSEIGRPARQLLFLDFYEDAFNILTARGGCPYRCPFCSASALWGGKRRPRPVEDIMLEVEEVVTTYGAEHIFLADDILTANRTWFTGLLDALATYEGHVTWGCATRVDCVDEPTLQRMAEVGFTGIQYGIESGAQEILDSVKGIKKDTALAAVRQAVALGISVSCSFMVPFPEDTEETLAETFAFMHVIQDAGGKLLISYTTPFPGTMYAEKADELGLRILTDDLSHYDAKHIVMETRHLTAARIEELTTAAALSLGMRSNA